MNRLRNFATPLLFGGILALASCDKAKNAVTAAKEKFRGSVDPSAPAKPGGEISPDLVSQVDSAAEGVRFRRDLPFPTDLKVRATERTTLEGARVVSTSVLGAESAPVAGTYETIGVFDRKGINLSVTIEKSGMIVEKEKEGEKEKDKDGKEKAAPPPGNSEIGETAKRLQSASINFEQTAKGWRTPPSKGAVDFNRMVWAKALQPALPILLATDGVMPRTQWFSSSKRWSGGDKFELTGDSLGLLFPGKASGKIVLTYEVSEALEGHPCGRFTVTGDVSIKDQITIEGESFDQETSIRSGKIWCSLLHPVVMREELDTVQTMTKGSGGAKIRIQGGVQVMRSRQWMP